MANVVASSGDARHIVMEKLYSVWTGSSVTSAYILAFQGTPTPEGLEVDANGELTSSTVDAYADARFGNSAPTTQRSIGSAGNRRFVGIAQLTVDVFTKKTNDGLRLNDEIVTVLEDGFEGSSSSSGAIQFRTVFPMPMASVGPYNKTRVVIGMEFDKVK